MAILPEIKSHEDLKKLSLEEMTALAEEIREKIVEVVAKNGGHLSPNLGVVELTIALHRVFDFAKDKIVWDVGHQCYTHKLLTGRQKVFHTLRLEDGIAGFPRREESEYDHFDTGHAGTSISAALGFAAARDLKSEKHNVVAFIGYGSMTSGLSFEGLNNAGALQSDLIVILNDNEMSISPNVGALSAHLNRIISGELFNRMRGEVDHILSLIPGVGRQVTNFTHRVEEAIKGIFVPGRIFEDFGFKYFGPIEGHNLDAMLNTLESVKKLKGPRLIHVVTRKGRGYKPAEDKPGMFHGTGPFDVKTGKKKPSAKKASFTSIFARTLTEIAEEDEKVIAITAAMREGTGLMEFAEKFPERLFDVGIAEQHAVTFAGAMAIEGFRPVVAIYSTFLQRAFDQVIHDVCKTGLPVTFAVDRAGIVGADGSTHQGLFDLSFLREVPNMTVMAPKDENELRHMIFTAINHNGPIAIRYPRGNVMGVALDQELKEIKIGEAELLKEGRDILICAIGNRVSDALAAAHSLEKKGCSAAIINARFAKPIDIKLISTWAKECGTILTVEENSVIGGFGSGVFEALRNTGLGSIAGETLGVPDMFVQHGSQESKRSQLGIDAEGIFKKALEMFKKPGKISTIARQAGAHRLQ